MFDFTIGGDRRPAGCNLQKLANDMKYIYMWSLQTLRTVCGMVQCPMG
jgi:hypothetical protein